MMVRKGTCRLGKVTARQVRLTCYVRLVKGTVHLRFVIDRGWILDKVYVGQGTERCVNVT